MMSTRVTTARPRSLLLGTMVALMVCTLPAHASAAPEDKERWDTKYSSEEFKFGKQPIPFLERHAHLLPETRLTGQENMLAHAPIHESSCRYST